MKKIIIILIVIGLAVAAGSVLQDFKGSMGRQVRVFVPVGSGGNEIIDLLKEKKVIRHKALFKMYIKDNMDDLKAGIHDMNISMGYKNALDELLKIVPLEETIKVTIPEGLEMREIAERIEESGLVSKEEFFSAAKRNYDFDFLKGIKRGEKYLEGYLFPATYDFSKSMSGEQIIRAMLSRFEHLLTDEYKERIRELNITIHEAVTMASIIEREAAVAEDRDIVSSVFYNRLKSATYPYLESCATVQYILEERKPVLSVPDTKIKSPYNTYQNKGLPPGPIASPGEASFKAALYPAETDYYFFVADDNGKHIFSKTYEEHLNAQRR